jgi:hypothetical protein
MASLLCNTKNMELWSWSQLGTWGSDTAVDSTDANLPLSRVVLQGSRSFPLQGSTLLHPTYLVQVQWGGSHRFDCPCCFWALSYSGDHSVTDLDCPFPLATWRCLSCSLSSAGWVILFPDPPPITHPLPYTEPSLGPWSQEGFEYVLVGLALLCASALWALSISMFSLGCVTWHFSMCCFLIRSFSVYILSVPCLTDSFQGTRLPHPQFLENVCVCVS